MDQNFLDKLAQITGKLPGDVQDLLGEMSLDDIYTLMNLVHDGSDDKIRDLLNSASLNKDDADANGLGADDSTDDDTDDSNGSDSDTSGVNAVPAQESFTLSFKFPKFAMREEALQLLEDHSIKYSFGLDNRVRVHCQSVDEMKLVQSITDSIATKTIRENSMSKKKDDNKIAIPASTPRDTAYGAMIRAQQAGEIRSSKGPNKKDRLRKADTKHKGRAFEGLDPYVSFWTSKGDAFSIILEQYGNLVTFNGKALKTNQKAWTRIQESLIAEGFISGKDFGTFDMKNNTVNEGVMGMTALPGLRRMMELAGVPTNHVDQLAAQPVEEVPVLPNEDVANDEFDNDPLTSDHIVDSDNSEDFSDALGELDVAAMGDEFDSDLEGGETSIEQDSAASSPAFNLIDDALNTVQSNLPDVKISEYKTLIQRLEELQVQLQQIGKSYLGV